MTSSVNKEALRIRIKGRVQGVGFRPKTVQFARKWNLTGWICNDFRGVEIWAEGNLLDLKRFIYSLRMQFTVACDEDSWMDESVPVQGFESFDIRPTREDGSFTVQVPIDYSLCRNCKVEIAEPGNRRFQYPFTTCNDCGPRYSILDHLPFDRFQTRMREFHLCPTCEEEYRDPENRRFHCQTISCKDCGPKLFWTSFSSDEVLRGNAALKQARAQLVQGKIVGLKGIGGFQLLARADWDESVQELRLRKKRPAKPFAIMVGFQESLVDFYKGIQKELVILGSPQNPILVLNQESFAQRNPFRISPYIAPGLNTVGLMLPTTPLHAILLTGLPFPVVVTSANQGDEPIFTDETLNEGELRELADGILSHDRDIAGPLDDSVIRVIADRSVLLRLARGFAPYPLNNLDTRFAEFEVPPILSVGGHQKVSLALWNGDQAALDGYLGAMESPGSRQGFQERVVRLQDLYRFEPSVIACDLHPDAFTTRWAYQQRIPVVRVQHHHAHAVAAMVEHGFFHQEILALTYDGSGYGPDGTIWGGEILKCSAARYERIGSLLPFPLLGGDAAVSNPGRIALALLEAAFGAKEVLEDSRFHRLFRFNPGQVQAFLKLVERKINSPHTSSLGRLFDGVALLLNPDLHITYEGEAAIWLEAVSDLTVTESYPVVFETRNVIPDSADEMSFNCWDWRPMIREMEGEIRCGESVSIIAAKFHNTIAKWAALAVQNEPLDKVVLGGGCFQNKLLTERTIAALKAVGKIAYPPGFIPPGDGGLAAGQLVVAMAQLSQGLLNSIQ